ncbi:endolytic transglycosylase MltG [Sporosarcina pasteurii]|uniref:YceG-like family n=1 Tax=Sporosarcina pasteurii TaxID=1474 RepID=A0A380BNH1_SPOPA|nr:endolytic transglycosylase MltG [Sporosarcina pasteurii]MDS9471064.1 endolytic transglycosylase MltG [Sporosarcina pasteurii]SUJ04222.1 YceG-like family [Sporosarcina pasteurii]
MKDILRIIGVACILSGTFLYFITNSTEQESEILAENNELKYEISALETKLQQTKAELANLQTLTSEANQSSDSQQQEIDEASNDSTLVETILHIESGTSSKDVANELANASIIEDPDALNTYLKTYDLAKKIQIGEYRLDSSMSIEKISKLITNTH